MRTRKFVLSAVLAVILILKTVSLGWSVVEEDVTVIASYALLVFFSGYTVVLSARSVQQNTTHSHGETITHIAVLTLLAAVLFTFSTMLPSAAPPVISMLYAQASALNWVWVAITILYLLATIIAFIMPMGPPMHYPVDAIYFKKTVSTRTNVDQENVAGVIGTSPSSSYSFQVNPV